MFLGLYCCFPYKSDIPSFYLTIGESAAHLPSELHSPHDQNPTASSRRNGNAGDISLLVDCWIVSFVIRCIVRVPPVLDWSAGPRLVGVMRCNSLEALFHIHSMVVLLFILEDSLRCTLPHHVCRLVVALGLMISFYLVLKKQPRQTISPLQ